MPRATGRAAAVLLSESRLTADTAEQFEHRCQIADLCAGSNDALPDRALAGWNRSLRSVASAEITAFRQTQVPVAKGFDARRSILTTRVFTLEQAPEQSANRCIVVNDQDVPAIVLHGPSPNKRPLPGLLPRGTCASHFGTLTDVPQTSLLDSDRVWIQAAFLRPPRPLRTPPTTPQTIENSSSRESTI